MYPSTFAPVSKELIQSRLLEIISRLQGSETMTHVADGHLVRDFGLDSLGMLELLMACENEFQVVIPEKEWIGITQLSHLTRAIQNYLHTQREVAA